MVRPPAVIDDLFSGKPYPAPNAIGSRKPDRAGLIRLSLELLPENAPKSGAEGALQGTESLEEKGRFGRFQYPSTAFRIGSVEEFKMDTTLTSFIWVWITLILVVNLFGIVGLFIGADSTWQALQEVKEIYSPFNVMNWILELLILSPALVAYVWRERRRKSLQAR